MLLKEAVEKSVGRADLRAALASVYRDLQAEIDARKPVCKTSGRCCRFEQFGHRLYVTTIELAVFWGALGPTRPQGWDGTGCPFQIDGLCSVHAIRPFGCRIFFCDASSNQWQNEQYERLHARLKRLHEQLGVPYFYVEWRLALRSLGLMPEPTQTQAKAGLSLGQLRL